MLAPGFCDRYAAQGEEGRGTLTDHIVRELVNDHHPQRNGTVGSRRRHLRCDLEYFLWSTKLNTLLNHIGGVLLLGEVDDVT